jgi:ABC-type sugar transport system substrate-binding protein
MPSTSQSPVKSWRRGRTGTIKVLSALAAVAVVAACGSSGTKSTGSTASNATTASTTGGSTSATTAGGAAPTAGLAATVAAALQATVPMSTVPPLMQEALSRVSMPLTAAQLAKAFQCWEASSCTLGSGKITLAEADGFGDNTWRKFSKMDAILQALTYPQVGKFIYTNAHGNLSAFQSDIRNLTAEGVKAIVAYNDFGPAAYPAFEAAQRAGAVISTFVGPADGAPTSAITTRVQPDICQAGQTMAAAVKATVGLSSPVAYFSGTPGNPQDEGWQKCATAAGVKAIFQANTQWTPAGAQEAASALIASGKPVKAILYSYSNPVPNIVNAYASAGKTLPAIITWTTDNGTLCQFAKKPYTLYLTNALNWAARVSVTAVVDKVGGQSVPAEVAYPFPFSQASAANCDPSKGADYPGPSALIPTSLSDKMLGA